MAAQNAGARVFAAFDRWIAVLDGILRIAGAAMMFAVMFIVAADVGSRYLLNAPFSWSYDLIGVYLMAGIFFFFISDTFRSHGHIAVDVAQNRFTPRARHASLCLVHAAAAVMFFAVLWTSAERAWQSYAAGEVLAGAIAWPIWVAAAFVPIGAALLLLRLSIASVGHALSFFSRRDVIPLPPLSGDEGAHW